MTGVRIAAIAAGAIATSYVIVAIVRTMFGRHLLDHPNERSSHSSPTPRGGGIGIVGTVAAGWLLLNGQTLIHVLLLALGIAVISLLDDLYSLGPVMRFLVHSAAAAGLMFISGYWKQFQFAPAMNINVGVAGGIVMFLWIVGLTNAYNFMDGIDGIAGTQAVVAAAGWYLMATSQPMTVASILIGGASIGFLLHNWPPARIFMGDVGSAFLGFSFAALGAVEGVRDPRLIVPAILVVWPFVFDTSFTMLRRLKRRERIYEAHRSHLYQRMVQTGMTHQAVTLIYGAAAIVTTAAAVALFRGMPAAAIWALLALASVSAALLGITLWRERSL